MRFTPLQGSQASGGEKGEAKGLVRSVTAGGHDVVDRHGRGLQPTHGLIETDFSFHSYDDTAEALRQVSAARRTLDDFGFRATELSFNEWLPLQKPRRETRGTALQAARIAAELIGLQNGPCDTAMIYDAKCGGGDYSPLFDPTSEKPRKAYYAFLAFNELRKLGTAVKCRVANPSVYATAAVRADRIAVMVANIGDSALPFSIEGIRLQSSLFRVTDENRTDEATDSLVVLPAHAFLVAVGALVD